MHSDRLLPGNAQNRPRVFRGQDGPSTKRMIAARTPGCAAVTRSRADRFARRHRVPRVLWPLIAAFIFVTLLIQRLPDPADLWRGWRHSSNDDNSSSAVCQALETGGAFEAPIVPGEAGGKVVGDPEPRYRPPPSFLAKEVVHIIAFLIRNRGRIDTEPVRMKWDMLDRTSLPLAVYLRDVEARGKWKELDAETLAVPTELCPRPTGERPRSLRHRKLLVLLPEWIARGEALISSVSSDGMVIDLTPDPVPDNPETSSWKP